eukprot:s3558_g2.t3
MALTRQLVLLELKLQLALDFLADDAVNSLAATNPELRKALASACAARHGHGYRHASGPFRLSESQLWRVLSLDDLSRFQHLLPAVTLVSELCLKDPSECMSLATAAAGLASETVDHHIYYALFTFDTDAAAKLFSGVEDEHDNNHWCSAKPCVDIVFDEHHMNVQIEAQCFEVACKLLFRRGRPRAERLVTATLRCWCSWYCHGPHVDEALMLSSLAELKSKGLDSGDLQLNLFQLDDGWQSAWGDWLHPHPQRFPNGLKPLVEAIKAAGLTAGLWLAPASLVAASKVAQEHPDWLLKDETGRPTSCGFTAPGLWMRALDTTHPEVQAHIRHMIHTIVHEWGFKYLKCDFLHCPALPAKRWDSKTSRAAAQATLLRIIREAAGKDVFILACGAPLGPCLGSVDAVRVSADTAPHWLPVGPDVFGTRWLFANDRTNLPSARNMVCSTMARLHAGGRLWVNDPDCLLLRSEVPIGEAQALATVSALSGGSMIFSDELSHIPQERLAILKALLPALPHAAQHVAFSWGDVPDKVMAELEPMAPCLGSWRLCGVFAWCDGRQVKELSLELPGSEDQQWHVFEFWSGAYYSARASLGLGPVEARCGRLLALRPRLDQADYLGSNIHVNQAEAHVGSVWNNAQEEETLQVATCVLRP